MIAAALLTLSVVALSSCATFDRNDVAVSVDGDSLSSRHLSDMVRSDLYATVLQSSVQNGVADADAMRVMLNAWIKLHVLERAGIFKDVDRNAVGAGLAKTHGEEWTSAPQSLRDIMVLNEAAGQLSSAGSSDAQAALGNLAAVDVYVDPRYGTWDAASGLVIPLAS